MTPTIMEQALGMKMHRTAVSYIEQYSSSYDALRAQYITLCVTAADQNRRTLNHLTRTPILGAGVVADEVPLLTALTCPDSVAG